MRAPRHLIPHPRTNIQAVKFRGVDSSSCIFRKLAIFLLVRRLHTYYASLLFHLSETESEAVDQARAGSQERNSSTANNTSYSKSKSVRVRAPGDAEEAAETARLRAKVVTLQEQLAIEQARKDAEAEKQREEKARPKQELHGQERP